MQYNPGWNGSSVNLLHVRAAGPGDSLHYVWSSIGAPAVLLVATRSPSSALRVNWTQLLSPSPAGAIWIEPPDSVVYSSAVVFTKVLLARGCSGTWELGVQRVPGQLPNSREIPTIPIQGSSVSSLSCWAEAALPCSPDHGTKLPSRWCSQPLSPSFPAAVRVQRGQTFGRALLPHLRPLRVLLGQPQPHPEPHGADGRAQRGPGHRPWWQLLQRQPGIPGTSRGHRTRGIPCPKHLLHREWVLGAACAVPLSRVPRR